MLRPISFSAISSTELKIVFNKELNSLITKNNFLIESIDGSSAGLEISNIEIDGNAVVLKTRPQTAGNYYLLNLLDLDDIRFKSSDGIGLVNDDVSRQLYFVGISNRNPIKDSIFQSIPDIYSLKNSNLSNVIDAQAYELYKAQKSIGEVLSDNYIKQVITDEVRARSSGATDRLANENAYSIDRVSKRPSNDLLIFKSIQYNETSEVPNHDKFPNYPVSLQEEYVDSEEVSVFSENNSFKEFVITLANKNVIAIKKVIHIRPDDVVNCNGVLGTEYKVDLYKYSILDNKYDPKLAFKNASLESNQIELSKFGNIPKPTFNDRFLVSYIYRDLSKNVDEETLSIFNIVNIERESVPSNSTRFYLKNAPIADSEGEVPELDGISFYTNENSTDLKTPFRKELVFNSAKLPSEVGEYSVNYFTGEVIIAGPNFVGEGTGNVAYLASYAYKNTFTNNLDYYVKNNDIVATPNRSLSDEEVELEFGYEEIFVRDVDYKADCHIEEINEHVKNDLVSSFSIKTKNSPITSVFKIYNQTTGEVYQPVYFNSTDIQFSGRRSPEIRESYETSLFSQIDNEELVPDASFVIPAFTVKVESVASNSSIKISPGIPEELINANTTKYFIRSFGLTGEDTVEDIEIKFFGEADSNGLINSVGISTSAQPPSLFEEVKIGPSGYSFNLENQMILSKTDDYIGSFLSSSINVSEKTLFLREKFFEALSLSPAFKRVSDNSFSSTLSYDSYEGFLDNISRLRISGDYSIDYENGKIYLATSGVEQDDFGSVSYRHNSIIARNKNIIAITEASRKTKESDSVERAVSIYENITNDYEFINVLDLESSLTLWGDKSALDLENNIKKTNIILDDYTIILENEIKSVRAAIDYKYLYGKNLNYTSSSERIADLSFGEVIVNNNYNVYVPGITKFEKNILDLKRYYSTKVSSSGENFVIRVNDSDASSIYKITYDATGEEIFNEKLNVSKISDLLIVGAGSDGLGTYAEIKSGPNLSIIDFSGDFLIDSNGSRFSVSGVDEVQSRIYVNTPAENAPTESEPTLGDGEVVNKVTVEYSDSGIVITIPSDSFLVNGDRITVEYVTKNIPPVGSKMAVDYNYGSLHLSYSYLYDDIYVSYEYGDNEIDWSISDSIQEGEEYYVSYKYGALRKALRDNFGILTKIPFFRDFSLTTDRELYRNALSGTIESFSTGPTKPSFENLIESFTDMTPDISEAAFNTWILGRNYLEPEKVIPDGNLKFAPSKHNEGLLIEDNLTITTPSVSNVNLTEGTLSTWITPNWNGIDNDAEIEVQIDNLGEKVYSYKNGQDIFDFESNFRLFVEKEDFSIVDSSRGGITLNNKRVYVESEQEKEEYSSYLIVKEDKHLDRILDANLNIDLTFDYIYNSDFSNIFSKNFGIDNPTYGKYGSAVNSESISSFAAGIVSFGDSFRSVSTLFSFKPVLVEDYKLATFLIDTSNVSKNNVEKYNRYHKTVNCSCSIKDTLKSLLSFRDEEFNSVKITFDDLVQTNLITENNIVAEGVPESFIFVDSNNNIFRVNAFLNKFSTEVIDSIPDYIRGVVVDRIPINRPEILALGSEAINQISPSGNCVLLYGTGTILTKSNSASKEALGYLEKSFILNLFEKISLSIDKKPIQNRLDIKLNKSFINLFYTDAIASDNNSVYSDLNLDRVTRDSATSEYGSIAIGCVQDKVNSSINITSLTYKLTNRFDLNDIYIGKNAISPRKNPFAISKDAFYPINSSPYNMLNSEGIFIWYDELCPSELSDNAGQWIFRTRIAESASVPIGVVASGSSYSFIYDLIGLSYDLTGRLITDGEFSSVNRSHRKENLDCGDGIICSSLYRYCGDGLLEDRGWLKINETNSDIINTIIGGSQNDRANWAKTLEFDTSISSGIYTIGPSIESEQFSGENSVYTPLPCYGGNYSVMVDFRVDDYKETNLGAFEGDISGKTIGITPIHIFDGAINAKIMLGTTNAGQSVILVRDVSGLEIVDIAYFEWKNGDFNKLIFKKTNNQISIETETQIISRLSTLDFQQASYENCSIMSQPFFAVNLFDSDAISSSAFHDVFTGNVISISLIEFSGIQTIGDDLLEDKDTYISTDKKIEFSFKSSKIIDGYSDGYDGYSDGYDGYIPEVSFDVDELRFTSDKLRYIFDSGESESKNRISLFKDGKGFLNFRIFDNGFTTNGFPTIYNIAKNIKNFKAGEIHHIAASWRLNTLYEKDEMHLFVDGIEVPNIFRFGGTIKAKINDKFSDIGKEVLQDFTTDLIEYYPISSDGTILAKSSVFSSSSFSFASDMMGRSIIFHSSDAASTYVGGKYLVGQMVGSGVIMLDPDTLMPVTFDVSANDIHFSLAPAAGIKESIETDLANSNFSIYITKCDQTEEEIGGIRYSVKGGEINIENANSIISPKYRLNVETGIIEFVGVDKNCNWTSTVELSDLDVHIKTFGLLFRGVNEKVHLSGSSYLPSATYEDNVKHRGQSYIKSLGGKSIFMSHAVEPISLSSVKITRVIKDRYIPDCTIAALSENYSAAFNTQLGDMAKLSSDHEQIAKANSGRYLTINIDSDNIVFCNDGYIDGYSDEGSSIIIRGKTLDGSNFEKFLVNGNGDIVGSKIFLEVNSVEGSLIVADPYYEALVLEIKERDPITFQNNNGEYAEIFRYANGSFIISSFGTNGSYPFELIAGVYSVKYPAFLNVKIPNIGHQSYFGTDLSGENPVGAILDDLKIITEMSSDTRAYEKYTKGTRSITRDYVSPNPSCPDDQTLLLVNFDDPINLQSRRLRQKEFLNTTHNYKFRLDREDREALLKYINNQEEFESKMIRMGFDAATAKETFVECSQAEGGPLFNDAIYTRNDKMLVSSMSVNNSFGLSAVFAGRSPLILNNDESIFRKNGGTIEFWISPILDTINDSTKRYYFDISSINTKRLKSKSPVEIELPNSAGKILSIKLIDKSRRLEKYYTKDEQDNIIFDEIERSNLTGVLEGGTGVSKNFSNQASLSPDGKTILLKEALPSFNTDIIVTYIPMGLKGERVSLYKNENSELIFSINDGKKELSAGVDIDWKRNTWHRVKCVWKANSSDDMIKLFVDGAAPTNITYGAPGIKYGGGYVYGESSNSDNNLVRKRKITLTDDFRVISIGGSILDNNTSLARIDNVRFSNKPRDNTRSPSGDSIDLDFSSNINTVLPVQKDDSTTFLLDIKSDEEPRYALVVDPKRGIFNFDIEIFDEFNKINTENIEDLIVELVNRLKPSHTNALVKFPRNLCK
tara:strand:- start:12662 stop:22402 length:9741 start_codon:yes stop_codon:yes gene_type:complete